MAKEIVPMMQQFDITEEFYLKLLSLNPFKVHDVSAGLPSEELTHFVIMRRELFDKLMSGELKWGGWDQ